MGVGIATTERKLFRERLDWMIPFCTKRRDTPRGSDADSLSPDVRALIESTNRLAIDLWRDALCLFKERTSTAGAWFGTRLIIYRSSSVSWRVRRLREKST
jgi:hypothetical protein